MIIGLTISVIMVGAYLAVGLVTAGTPKVLWSTNPAFVEFSGNEGAGSLGSITDAFKCAPPVSAGVTLRVSVENPAKISLTVQPSSLVSCGPSFTTVTLIAHCLVSACNGSYTGTVTVFKGTYSTIPPSLSVNIVVA